jgi:hypothetical protein
MEQENVGTIIPGEEIPPNTVVDTENTETPSPEIEARARAMGWRPQEEFNGDPNKWKPAADFVAKGENDLPVLRENLRRTTSTITDLQARFARQEQENKATVERLERMSEAALKRQKDTLEAQYQAAMRNAAANGDVDAYDRLDAGRRQAVTEFDTQVAEVKRPVETQPQRGNAPSAEDTAKIEGWINRNPWYRSDMELNHAATAYSSFLTQQNPNMGLDENLKQTEAHMRKRYADKFGTVADPPAVEGGGTRMTASASRGKGWNDLPSDARAQAAKLIKEGLFKDQNDYAKEYWSQ